MIFVNIHTCKIYINVYPNSKIYSQTHELKGNLFCNNTRKSHFVLVKWIELEKFDEGYMGMWDNTTQAKLTNFNAKKAHLTHKHFTPDL